jgi:hypothetical protein
MTPEKLFHQLLGLGLNWEVTDCVYDRGAGGVRLRVRETQPLWQNERSPGLGGPVEAHDRAGELVWRHLNVFGHLADVCVKPGKKKDAVEQLKKALQIEPDKPSAVEKLKALESKTPARPRK